MVGGGEAIEAVAPEQVSMRSSTDQQSHVVKGKRTKRQRPQSPIPFVVSTNSTTGDHGGGLDSTNVIHDHKSVNNHANLSPASSAEYMDSTEEDEDMANCLILLAQCQSRDSPKQQQQQTDDDIAIQNKFNSRRFLEAPSSGNGKAGYYVYECKTCNRTFPSFQALGGHRASHKKPKAAMNNDERRSNFIFASDEEEGNFKNVFQLSHMNNHRANLYNSSCSNNNNNNKSGKVHECSICGAEFTSGQALGGHMRRHRAPVGTNTTLSLTPMVSSSDEPKKARNVLSLDLDLNLPAPEDDLRESKPPFASKQQTQQQQQQQQQQKPALVFSAPTLVDCHY